MQAYAHAERFAESERPRPRDPMSSAALFRPQTAGSSDADLVEGLLARLADLVVDRLVARGSDTQGSADDWMDARDAAAYLGVHRDTLRKLAAQRAIPTHQEGPGCKLYFRRDELDEWRRSGGTASSAVLRAVS